MHSIRWKLLLASLIIVFVPVSFLSHYFISSFDKFTRTVQEEDMAKQAVALCELYKGICLTGNSSNTQNCSEKFATVIDNTGRSFHSELMLLSPEGVILFASSNATGVAGQDISGRQEVGKAMSGHYGATWRLEKNRNLVYYDIAVPLKTDKNEVIAIAHVTQHTSQITKAIMKIRSIQQKAMIISLIVASLVAVVLAYTLTGRLRKLTKASVDYAKGGRLLDDFTVKGKDEVATLGSAIKNMAAEIDKRNRYNRDFVSTIMHEVKTPLTAIKGAAEVLSGSAGANPELRKKFLTNIMIETERLICMTGELMELTRIDTENMRVDKKRIDYSDFIRKVVERLEPTFNGKHVSLEADIPSTSVYVYAIEDRIEQVIANLLDNAVRYSPVDGVVQLRLEVTDGMAVVTIKDSGPGIPPVNIDRVFNRFFTTESKGNPRDYGSGIGLAIAKSIVENHNGEIRVESEVGKGTIFAFSLPIV